MHDDIIFTDFDEDAYGEIDDLLESDELIAYIDSLTE